MAEKTEKEVSSCVQEESTTEPPLHGLNETDQCQPCKLSRKLVCASKYCDECEELLCEDCVTNHAKRKATASHKPIKIGEKKNVISCSPCTDEGNMVQAITYCEECEEYLCNDCKLSHGKRKATRTHKPITIKDMNDKLLNKDETITLCDPCKYNFKEKRSLNYCKECDEYLCGSCTNSHKNRNATKTHDPVPSAVLQKEEKERDFQNRKICDLCQFKDMKRDATSFCDDCEELLCGECTNHHRSKKITRSHALESPECVEYIIIVCEVCELEDKEAVMYCNSCDEALCDDCGQIHKNQIATKTHPIDSIPSRKLERIVKCDSCSEGFIRAVKYCTNCAENYCGDCVRVHSKQKMTKDHTLVNPVSGSKNKNAQMKEVALCKGCSESKILMKYCTVCEHGLCEQCCEIHGRSKFTSSHELKESDDIEEMNCDSCKSPGSAEYYCEQCDELFCTICNKQHQRSKTARDHKTIAAKDGLIKRRAQQHIIDETMQFR
jgi:hypothetical protein